LQHLLELHPSSVYPNDWSQDPKEDRVGYISMEKSDVYAATAAGALKLAGLEKVVKVGLTT
jgi:catechol O-methyltransferase